MLGEKAGKPSAQRNLLRVLRTLLDVRVKLKMRRDNPARGIKLNPIKTSGYHSWTEAELRQYEARHPVGTKARLALDLLLYTAERRTDVVAFGPPHMRNGRFIYTASKNGAEAPSHLMLASANRCEFPAFAAAPHTLRYHSVTLYIVAFGSKYIVASGSKLGSREQDRERSTTRSFAW